MKYVEGRNYLKRKQTKEFIYPESIPDISRTGDTKTNDFDLSPSKMPALSTIKKQLQQAEALISTAKTIPQIIEFDRLKIGVNLIEHGRYMEFEDWGLEDVETPEKQPSYIENTKKESAHAYTERIIKDDNEYDISDLFEDEDFDNPADVKDEERESVIELSTEIASESDIDTAKDEPDIFSDSSIKRRIRYDDIRDVVGLNNLYILKGVVLIDITGKLMADRGVLGSLNRNNIRDAIERIRELHVINFDVDKFIERAQVYICDVCVDMLLENISQISRYIDGICSFSPLASNRFNIAKYGKHGLQIKPISKTLGRSFAIYNKGKELSYSIKRTTKATIYTDIIGDNGVELANRTIRFELKLYKLKDIREVLNVQSSGFGVVKLTDVLNSTVPVILQQLELFCGTPEILFDRITLLQDAVTTKEKLSLAEIFIAERFVEIFKENGADMNALRSHIRTEYANVEDSEIEKFVQLANMRGNILNFLAYRKPKSVTIMLDVLRRLYTYYSDMERVEDD